MKKSVANLGLNTSSTMLSMSRNGKTHHTNTHTVLPGVQLTTPTSISMMNSFIIKNADTSFDQYYTSMKKRKQMQGGGGLVATFNNNASTLGGMNN